MPSVIGLGYADIQSQVAQQSQNECDCTDARRGCMPTFVFSVEGQVSFRSALDHLVHCRKTECVKLRRLVLKGMRNKLQNLFTDTVFIGCIHVQPHIYGARRMRLSKDNFSAVCQHLANCPQEACARLRRSLLLAVRDVVSPNAQPRE